MDLWVIKIHCQHLSDQHQTLILQPLIFFCRLLTIDEEAHLSPACSLEPQVCWKSQPMFYVLVC